MEATSTLHTLHTLPDDELITLYDEHDWIAAAYHLRWRWRGSESTLDESQLLLLAQWGSPVAKEELFRRAKADYTAATDEVLALMMQKGDKDAKEQLVVSFLPHVTKNINRFEKKGHFVMGYKKDDLINEGVLGLFKAVRDFKIEKKTKFKIFARHVIDKHINSLIWQSSNKKLKTLNDAFSCNTPIGGNDSEITFEQLLRSDSYDPEDIVMKHETFYGIWATMTELEKKVLWYYAEDYSYQEIGDIVYPGEEKSPDQKRKAVDNTVQRFKKKKREYEKMIKKM